MCPDYLIVFVTQANWIYMVTTMVITIVKPVVHFWKATQNINITTVLV